MKKIIVLTSVLVTIFFLVSSPLYDYFSYHGKLPFMPWAEFSLIPESSPEYSKVFDKSYRAAASNSMLILKGHKKQINAPAISAAIAINGEVKWSGVVGWSNIEQKIPADIDTQFRIGSTSKALTAMGLASLVDKGIINLDAPISGHLKPLPNLKWASMTARQLASHRAGLPHYKDNNDYAGLYETLSLSNHYDTAFSALAIFDGSDLVFKPGTDFGYSTFGTVLLSAVMEKASGRQFSSLMQESVFEPLAMVNTMTEKEARNRKESRLSQFYWNDKGTSRRVKPWRKVDLSHRLAGGGFVSTSTDLVKLGSTLLNDAFVSNQVITEFLTPQKLPSGESTPHNYALGWRMPQIDLGGKLGKITLINHGGVSRGAQSILAVIPELSVSIALNINANTRSFSDFTAVLKPILNEFVVNAKTDG